MRGGLWAQVVSETGFTVYLGYLFMDGLSLKSVFASLRKLEFDFKHTYTFLPPA